MKLKMDEAGHAVVLDGKPVYVDDDGRDHPFDYPHTLSTLSKLRGEAKGHRERADGLGEKLKAYDGIEDAEAARAAIETIRNLDSGKLFQAGKVEEIKAEAKRAFDEQVKALEKKYQPVIAERDTAVEDLRQEKIGGAFSRSKYITDKLVIPADLVQARFGSAFRVEDGKVVGRDPSGSPIYSIAQPGNVASFDEALEILVNAYPARDSILKGSGASGGGAGGGGASAGGKRNVTRAQFNAMSPGEQQATARDKNVVLTD